MTDKWFPLSMLAVAIGLYIGREGSLFKYSGGLLDSTMGVLMLLLIAWLLWPSSKKNIE